MYVTVNKEQGPDRPGPGAHAADLRFARRLMARDPRAVEEFADQYVAAVFRFALSRLPGEPDAAKEAAQTAMAKAIGRLDTFRGQSALLTWLCACCRNEILMLKRRRGTRPVVVSLDDDTGIATRNPRDLDEDPEAALLSRERSRLVHVVLDSLPPQWARALEWKYVDRLSTKEIADRLATSPKAAESLLGRARAAFRRTHDDLLTDLSQGDGGHGR